MKAFDSFANIFDNGGSLNIRDSWEITEKGDEAQLKRLRITFKDGIFSTIENGTYKGLFASLKHYSSFLDDDDCDGIAFLEKDGKKSSIPY